MVRLAYRAAAFPIRSVYLSEAVLRCSFLGYSSPPRSAVSWLTRIDARTMRLSASAIVPQVPGKGLEPSCLYRAADFESAAAAISPPGRIADMHSFHLRRSVQEKPFGTDGSCSAQNADNKKGAPCGAPYERFRNKFELNQITKGSSCSESPPCWCCSTRLDANH